MNKKYSFLCIILLYTCANIFAQAVTINGNHSQKSVTKKQNVGQNNEEHITKISNKTKSFMGSSNQASTPKVGIWYSTWHAKENNYLWVAGHGRGSSNQFLADVNGDGKADAVAFFGDSGEWYVSLSNGEEFEAYTLWVAGHGTGSSNQILADVNGDGKDDAAVFFNASGEWYVSLSSGTGFGGYSLWTAGHGTGSTNQFLADVNGDGKADAVVFADNVGEWNVAVSNGTRFGGYSLWTAGHGTGSTNQFLKDVNGDGKADAVVFAENVGDWNVSVSTGSGFAGYSLWRSGDGVGSKNQFISDVDGDGKGDAVLFFDNNTWFVSLSNGTGFKASKRRLAGHGVGSTNQFLGDVTGDGNSDAVIFDGNPSAVEWYVMSDLTGKLFKPNMVNTWQAWNMDYLPISKTRGHYQYDNLEEDIVDEHIEMIVDAGIDFIIFDATNNLEVDGRYILNRAEKFIERVQIWNNAHKVSKQLKYSFAIGGSQFNNNINTLIIEANYVYDNYFSKDPDNYYITAQNKPLLSNYSNTEDREKWLSSGQLNDIKNKFDLQWIKGGVDEPGLYGWANSPAGPIADNNVMVVMPGWRNGLNSPGDSPRDNGAYYLNSWAKVLEVAPKTVIINSFNEYAERTALAPSGLTPTFDHINDNEKWRNTAGEIDDYFYWRETVRFIKIFRGCAEPVNLGVSNISTTTVDLSWNTVPTADNGYEWLVMAAGVAPNTATAIAAGTTASGTTTAQAAGLSESTEYETYVRANCDTGVSSSWSRVVSFITASTFKTWTGAINNNWTTTGNWNTSVAPLLDDNIVIPNTAARQPVIGASSGVSLNNLDIATVASLSITSGGSLIVKGTATGNITYNLAIPDNNWHLVSSPVVGEQYNNTWVTDNLIPISANFNRGISTYDNSATFATGRWSYFKGGTTETFNAGIGYSMLRSAAGNFSFTGGFPTTNEISPAISQNDNSWNLLGNPYPSYIDIAKFIDANTLKIAPAFRAIYVWDGATPTTGRYNQLTTGYLHPGKAFFINSNVSNGIASITEAMQSHLTSGSPEDLGLTFFRSAKGVKGMAALNPNQIRTAFFTDNNLAINLQLSDGEAGVNTQIYYLEGKTAGLDPGFDIGTFDGVSFNLNVFTQLVEDYKGINFEVQSLPNENYAALIIPVGVKVAAGKEIIFSAEVLNLPSDIKIFLEDKATKKFTRLDETNSEYRVTLEKSLTGVGRFYLHTTSSVLATAAADVSNISIYSSNQKVYFSGLSADKTKVSILNVLGKKILEKSFEANGDHTIFLANIATGIYLVQLQTEKGRVTKKIIIE